MPDRHPPVRPRRAGWGVRALCLTATACLLPNVDLGALPAQAARLAIRVVVRVAHHPAPVRPTSRAAATVARPGPSRVPVLHLRRAGLAAPSEVWIYRPDVPDSAALPVVYFLHGHPGQPADLFHAGLRRVMDRYIARGGSPFVIAAPNGNSSVHMDTEWGDASDGSDEVESFLLGTVIPAVEGPHPRTAARRAIVGFSMGGFGAMNIALRHPDLFGQIVTIAGYFRLDDSSQMFATAQARLANSPVANVARASGKRILLVEDRDEPSPLIRGQSSSFQRQLAGGGAAAVARTEPGAHDLAFVVGQVPEIAGFLDRGFAAAPGA